MLKIHKGKVCFATGKTSLLMQEHRGSLLYFVQRLNYFCTIHQNKTPTKHQRCDISDFMTNKDKRYTCIVKVSQNQFLKYRLNDLKKFVLFLDTKYPEWRWFNVYSKKTKEQLASFTKNNKPTTSFID